MPNQENKSILIIEDTTSLRTALRLSLVKTGATIYEAPDGKTGLELAILHHPDLILLDLEMPIMDGFTMLEKLRKEPYLVQQPKV